MNGGFGGTGNGNGGLVGGVQHLTTLEGAEGDILVEMFMQPHLVVKQEEVVRIFIGNVQSIECLNGTGKKTRNYFFKIVTNTLLSYMYINI